MEAIRFAADDWRGWRRMRALELKQDGWRQRDIASALGVSEVCVSRWLALVRQNGVAALRSQPAAGPAPKLTTEQKSLIPNFFGMEPRLMDFVAKFGPVAALRR